MALGGGTFTTQTKTLPGSYINFVSAAKATAEISERGIAALPLELDWGIDGEIFRVDSDIFASDAMKYFGYAVTDDALKGLRDFFKNAKTGYFYKVNAGGDKAAVTVEALTATAKYTGKRGNALNIVVAQDVDTTTLFEVSTYLGTRRVDTQKVSAIEALVENDYVKFSGTGVPSETAGSALEGGTNGTVESANYQDFLDRVESYSFNTLGCLSTDETVKGLFAAFTARLRDEMGVKFQCVLHRYAAADHEGVISVENNLAGIGATVDPSLVYWVTGAEAGCAVNKSVTNKKYDGEFSVDTKYTQKELEAAIEAGKLILHSVGSDVRVLLDINTLQTTTEEKSEDFKDNSTVRVLDQIANDVATLFNAAYVGKIQNDASGRMSLWNDIVKLHQSLQDMRAIEDFTPDQIVVSQGESKTSVLVTDVITPVNAMTQLYMTVVVE